MTPVALPELPEPDIDGYMGEPAFTEKTLIAAILAERAAERARCAALCDQAEQDNIANYATDKGMVEGLIYKAAEKQATRLAAAIRSQP